MAAPPSIDYVVLTAGSFDVIAEVACGDDGDLLDLLNTLAYLKLVKQQHNWGPR